MIWLYMLPYSLLSGLFGTLGCLIAVYILVMGILRVAFFSVLLITGDMARLKAEHTEGLSVVIEKIKTVGKKIAGFFN